MAGLTITIDSADVTSYIDVRSITIESSAESGVATCEFIARDHDGGLSLSCKNEIDIDDDGTTLFAGEIVDLVPQADGVIAEYHVICHDWNILLDERAFEAESWGAGESDSDIIDELFTEHRSDIDSTTYVATVEASMPEIAFDAITIREALEELCGITGARFYVDFAKNLHYFSTEANAAAFSLSTSPNFATSFPMFNCRPRESAAKLATRVLVRGKEIATWRTDAGGVAAHGNRDAILRVPYVDDVDVAVDMGDAVLDRYAVPAEYLTLSCHKDGLVAGQSITVVNATLGIDATYYIREIVTTIESDDADTRRRYDLSLGLTPPDLTSAQRAQVAAIRHLEQQSLSVSEKVYDTDAPAAPTFENANLATGVTISDDGTQIVYIQATWGEVGDADLDHYQIQCSTSSDFSGYTDTRQHPSDGDRLERFSGLIGNTVHYFRIRAVDWVGNVSDWSTTRNITSSTDTSAPADPTTVAALATPISVHLTWDANTERDLAGYDIQRKLDGGAYATISTGFRGTLFIDNNVTTGSAYWYKVRAVDTSGNASNYVEIAAAVTVLAIMPIDIAAVHSIALDGILALWHFDGPKPYNTNFIVDTVSNHGHVAIVTGGVIGRPGKFGKGVQVTTGYTNLVINSSFEVGTTGWYTGAGANTIAQSGDHARYGAYSCKCTYQDNTNLLYNAFTSGLTAAQHYASAWIWVPSDWDGGNISLVWGNFAGDTPSVITQWTAASDPAGEWFRIVSETTLDAGDLVGNLFVSASSAPTAGRYIYVDAVQVTETAYIPPYWDDSLNDSTFAHDSTSTRVACELAYDNLASQIGPQGSVCGWWVVETVPSDSVVVYLFDAYSDSSNRILLRCAQDDKFDLYINGAYYIGDIGSGSLARGDEIFWCITWDFDADEYTLDVWENGTHQTQGTSSMSLTFPTLTYLSIGSMVGGADQINGVLDDVCILNRVLSSDEMAQIAESDAPLIDASQAYWVSEWQGWGHDLEFSATDNDTVAWAAGTITLRNGQTYSIDAGNTGNMSAVTYVYLDRDTSETELQTTTTAANAVGVNRLLIAVCEDVAADKNATFQVFGGAGNLGLITADEIAANTITAGEIAAGTITADEIAANTITAAEIAAGTITGTQIAADTITAANIAAATITATEMNVATLSAISANLGTITAGTVTGATLQTAASGARIVMSATGFNVYNSSAATVFNIATTGAGFVGAAAIVWSAAGAVSLTSVTAGGGDCYLGNSGLFFESGDGDTNGIVWKSSVPSGDTEGYIRIRTDNALELACGGSGMGSYYEILITQVSSSGTLTPIRVSASNKAVGIFSGTISATPEGTLFVRNNDDGDWPVAFFEQNKTGGSNQPVIVMDQAATERTIFKVVGSTSGSSPTISTAEKTTFTKAFKVEAGGAVGWINVYT